MFRDLKEYQEIQKIYEERVCISEEERYITKEFENTFTEDEIDFIVENTEEVFAEIRNQLAEEGSEIGEETIDEAIGKIAIPLAQRMAKAAVKNKNLLSKGASSGSGGMVKKLADTASKVKKVAGGGMMKKVGGAAGDLKKKAGQIIQKGVGFVKKAAPILGAGAVGAAISTQLPKNNKPKVDKDAELDAKIKKGIKDSGMGNQGTAITQKGREQAAYNRGERAAREKLGDPTLNSNVKKKTDSKPTQASPAPQRKMSSIERKNRDRFGDAHVDRLKAKQVDFKAMRKGTMSKADFIKKYPKSITAQREAGLRDHTEWDAYDMVLEYLFSTEQVSTIEEANYVMTEMDSKTIQSIISD